MRLDTPISQYDLNEVEKMTIYECLGSYPEKNNVLK